MHKQEVGMERAAGKRLRRNSERAKDRWKTETGMKKGMIVVESKGRTTKWLKIHGWMAGRG